MIEKIMPSQHSPCINQQKIYVTWALIVFLNTLAALYFSLEVVNEISGYLGMLMGIFTFIALYSKADIYLLNNNRITLSKQLRISACLRLFTFCFPVIDGMTGLAALHIPQLIFDIQTQNNSPVAYSFDNLTPLLNFSAIYLTTIIDGILLTILVGLIILLVKLVFSLIRLRQRLLPSNKTGNNTL